MTEQLRSVFESIQASEGAADRLKRDSDGRYLDQDVALAWHWFNKSRTVLTIELPEEWDVGATGPQMVMDSDEVKAAIKAAGLTVKE